MNAILVLRVSVDGKFVFSIYKDHTSNKRCIQTMNTTQTTKYYWKHLMLDTQIS